MQTSVAVPLMAYPQEGWNQTAQDYPRSQTLASLFERQVARTPDATAVRCGTERLDYLALNARANRLAHHLRQRGAGPGAVVGIALPQSIDALVAVLAVLKAGAAYLALDGHCPPQQLTRVLDDADCRWLIGRRRALWPYGVLQAIAIDDDAAAIAGEAATNPVPFSSAENAACVIHGDHSEDGGALGVRMANRGVVNLLHGLRAHLQVWRGDVLLAQAPLSSSASVIELFVPLCSGACVAIAPPEAPGDAHELVAALAEHGATIFQAPPATWRALIEAGLPESRHLTALVSGGVLPRALGRALAQRAGSVWTLHGHPETTVASIITPFRDAASPAGRPLANTQAFILDDDLRPVPRGDIGDLFIGGDGLALGDPRRFIENPFAGHEGERLFRTGDRARYTEYGEIEILASTESAGLEEPADRGPAQLPGRAPPRTGAWERAGHRLRGAVRHWLHRGSAA